MKMVIKRMNLSIDEDIILEVCMVNDIHQYENVFENGDSIMKMALLHVSLNLLIQQRNDQENILIKKVK